MRPWRSSSWTRSSSCRPGGIRTKGRSLRRRSFATSLLRSRRPQIRGFSVSRYEIEKQGTAYTADTLEFLAAQFAPNTQLFFITGADALLDLLTWKDPAKVLALSTLVAASRPGYDLSGLPDVLAKLVERHGDAGLRDRVKLFDIPSLDISSSMIRQRLRLGRPVRYLLPQGVAELVEKSNHYREAASHQAGGEGE